MTWKVPYGRHEITQEDVDAITSTLYSDFLTQGPQVEKLEEGFKKFVGADYALACNTGTAGLHLAMLALDVKPGQKILTTPLTFASTSNSALFLGAEVEFVDISLEDYLIDLDLLEKKLEEPGHNYVGITIVSFAGQAVDGERLRQIADKHNIWLVEDACHAPGSTFIDSKGEEHFAGNGKYFDLTVFSFHPVKHIACGEGGMVTTKNKDLFEKIKLYRNNGVTKEASVLKNTPPAEWYYEMQVLGYNFRLSDIHAALGVSQLSRLNDSLKKRREIAKYYDEKLADLPVVLPKINEGTKHAFHLYVIRVEKRDEFYNFLREKGIYSQIHYIPVYHHPYYQELGFEKGLCPNAETYYSECISLPMFPSIKDEELAYVVETIKSFYN